MPFATRPARRQRQAFGAFAALGTLFTFLFSACGPAVVQPPAGATQFVLHLPDALADGVGIVVQAAPKESLFACYWQSARNGGTTRLRASRFSLKNGPALGARGPSEAQPARARNGGLISFPLLLYASQAGTALACTGLMEARLSTVWSFASPDLHTISAGTLPEFAETTGISAYGTLLSSWLDVGGIGTPAATATILSTDVMNLSAAPHRTVIHFVEPAWRLNSLGLDGLFWVQNERIAANGEPRLTAYSVETGKPVATRQVPLLDAAKAAPPALPRPKGMPLLPPTTLPPPQTPDLPQLTQIQAGHGRLLAVVNQTGSAWHAWSRLLVLSATSARELMSPVLDDCDLWLSATSPDGRWAIGSCDRVGRVWFDNYAIQRSEGVILSTETGAILATFPLNKRRPPLSMAVAGTAGTIIAAIYDHVGEIRILRFPDSGAHPN